MPSLRKDIMSATDLVVVKVGTRVLTRPDGTLDDERVAAISDQLAAVKQQGRQVVLVSSGAVAAGLGRLGLDRRPTNLAELQAAAAVGQSRLLEAYDRALSRNGIHAAQVLLTAEDLQDRSRYLNVRNTLLALFRFGAIAVINENDTVSVEELQISFGDNDRLAALVTNLLQAPLLVLLSDVEGLFDGNPADSGVQLLPTVTDLAGAQRTLVHDRKEAGFSTGGMASKLQAAQIAVAAGENVVIANGRRENVLLDVLAAKDVGTLIVAEGPAVAARKRWIGWSAHPRGKLRLDDGAKQAVIDRRRSLLAVGVAGVEGEFAKGDVVALCDAANVEFARGLSNYSAAEVAKIAGEPTERIAELLGHCPYGSVVHRDNLIVLV